MILIYFWLVSSESLVTRIALSSPDDGLCEIVYALKADKQDPVAVGPIGGSHAIPLAF